MTGVPLTASVVPAPLLPPARSDGATVDALTVSAGGGGLVLGRDRDGDLVTLALFRPEPTVAVAVGPLALVQVLVLRALALGAAVVVETTRTAPWTTFAQLAAGTTGSVEVTGRAGQLPPGTLTAPRLLVVDLDTPPGDGHRVGGWAAQLTLVEGVSQWSASGLGSADVVLAQGLGSGQAQVLGRALGLADPAAVFGGLPPDVVTLADRSSHRDVQVAPTSVEQWLLQAAARR